MNTSKSTWGLVVMALIVCFLLYRGCQQAPLTVKVEVTPVPIFQVPVQPQQQVAIERVAAQPTLSLREGQGAPTSRYYAINQARLYCLFITNDLKYTGEPNMQVWWTTVEPALKQWYFNACQR